MATPPKVVEKIVEKIVEKPVDRVVEKVVEKVVQDTRGIEERDRTIAARDEEIARLRRPPDIDLAAAKAAGLSLKHADDLEIIEGIGPKIAELLRADGITTFLQLSNTSQERIRGILDKAGPNFRIADPGTWPEQADLAARNRWASLKTLQGVLVAGVRVDNAGLETEVKDLRLQLASRDAELKRMREPVVIDLAAAKAAGFNLKNADDLEIIEGIGPKIAQLFYDAGVKTFAALSKMTPAQIQPILDKGGANFKLADPGTWPEQADLAANNRWTTLKALQDALNAGKR